MVQDRPGTVHASRIIFAAAALLPVLAWRDHHVVWTDEIYQSLKQVHLVVFEDGLPLWESRDGVRSWLFPGAIAVQTKLAGMLGLQSAIALVTMARCAVVCASMAAIWFATKLAAHLGGGPAAIATVVVASRPFRHSSRKTPTARWRSRAHLSWCSERGSCSCASHGFAFVARVSSWTLEFERTARLSDAHADRRDGRDLVLRADSICAESGDATQTIGASIQERRPNDTASSGVSAGSASPDENLGVRQALWWGDRMVTRQFE